MSVSRNLSQISREIISRGAYPLSSQSKLDCKKRVGRQLTTFTLCQIKMLQNTPALPSFLPFYFRVCAFSTQPNRLSRSLEQARFGNKRVYVRFVSFSTARHAGSFLCFKQRQRTTPQQFIHTIQDHLVQVTFKSKAQSWKYTKTPCLALV